jgi:hypothetical protein
METTPHVDAIRAALEAVAGDDAETVALANRMVTALTPALHLQLLDLLGQMALEVSQQLPDGRIDLQLAGRDAVLVYRPDPGSEPVDQPEEGSETSRLTLRMPESLKNAIESAADADGVSTNAWLVGAARRALAPTPGPRSRGVSGKRITGYVQA